MILYFRSKIEICEREWKIMDMTQLEKQLDALFQAADNEGNIDNFLTENTKRAKEEGDMQALLWLYNETMGFYREAGTYEKSLAAAQAAITLAGEMGVEGTIPYATTLLNAANACRAAGHLEESLAFYQAVEPIYQEKLAADDMYFASFYNNLSLLKQEMGDFAGAGKLLQKALAIVETKPEAAFETAVTYANLANTCIQLGESSQAREYASQAVSSFEAQGVDDAHYSAALSALGSLCYQAGEYEQAIQTLTKARACVQKYLGTENIQYQRLSESIQTVKDSLQAAKTPELTGLALCRAYYETYGKPMLHEQFAAYEDRIAVGLVGKGSDCFGYDDAVSRDHDFGPRFVLWVTRQTYEAIGEKLQQAYESLPASFQGIERTETFHGRDRAGVQIIEDFYAATLGTPLINDATPANWLATQDYALAAAVNGKVFRDDEGLFTGWRDRLKAGYPKAIRYRKLAECCALFSQNGQYNLPRQRQRGQLVAAQLAKAECMRQAMKLAYLLTGQYAPHDKWLYKGLDKGELLAEAVGYVCEQTAEQVTFTGLLDELCLLSVEEKDADRVTRIIEMLAVILAYELERQGIIGRSEAYLDANVPELLAKSDALLEAGCGNGFADKQPDVTRELSAQIARAEFEAFDKVHNEGGRASCQNNWPTFRVMRMSQYMTWDEDMLLQYLYEFRAAYAAGRNLIQEKYARMMESTAPQKYAEFAAMLPPIGEERRAVTEEIIRLQVQWMEAFAEEYPALAENARLIHTSEDMAYDTSYETYLRGELGTYSEKLLTLYGRYIVRHVQSGSNVAKEIMTNTVHFYGYGSLEDAAKKNGEN